MPVDAVGQLLDELVERLAARLEAALSPDPAEHGGAEAWRLLKLDEAAAILGRSERWVRERVKGGELPHVRLDGGALAFQLEDLQAFAAARRVEATAGVLAVRWQPPAEGRNGAGLRREPRPTSLRVEP